MPLDQKSSTTSYRPPRLSNAVRFMGCEGISPFPPWETISTFASMDIASQFKKTEPAEKGVQVFKRVIENDYKEYTKIYTDGSQ